MIAKNGYCSGGGIFHVNIPDSHTDLFIITYLAAMIEYNITISKNKINSMSEKNEKILKVVTQKKWDENNFQNTKKITVTKIKFKQLQTTAYQDAYLRARGYRRKSS